MAAKFWIGGAGTWDNTNDVSWSTTSGGSNDTTHPTTADDVTFDASSGGGVVLIGVSINVKSITMGAFTGTLNFTNFPNVTLQTFSGTGAGTRTLIPGTGTWTLTGTGTIWTTATTTNLVFSGSNMNIVVSDQSATGKTLTGGGLVFKSFYYQGTVASITLTNMNFIDGATLIPLPYNEIRRVQSYLNTKAGTVGLTRQQAMAYLSGDANLGATFGHMANEYAGTVGLGYSGQAALNIKVGNSDLTMSKQEAARRL